MALGNLRKPKQEDTPQAGLFRMPNTLIGNSVRQATAAQEAQTKLDNQNFSKMLAAQGKEDTIGRQIGYDAGSAFFRPIVNKLFPSDEMKLAQENETIQAGFSELLTDDMTQKQRLETIGGYLLKNNRAQEGMQFLQLASSIKDESNAPLSSAGKAAYDLGYVKGTPEYEKFITDYSFKEAIPKKRTGAQAVIQDSADEWLGRSIGESVENASSLEQQYNTAAGLLNVLGDEGFGGLESTKFAVNNLTEAVGLTIDSKKGAKESFVAVMGKLVNDILKSAKGIQTDADEQRVSKTLSKISDTPQGARFKLQYAMALNSDIKQRNRFIREYAKTNENALSSEIQEAWDKYVQTNPVASDIYVPKGKNKDGTDKLPKFFAEHKRNLIAKAPDVKEEEIIALWNSNKKSRL